jgi:NTP pyrophosphatase (non-canonical NTP hydrolase)
MDHNMYECSEAERGSEWTHERYVETLQQFIVYPPEKAQEYLECLLFSEIGEVVGVHAKYVRGDFDETEYKKRLIGELGDVLFACSLRFDDFEEYLDPGCLYYYDTSFRKLAEDAKRSVYWWLETGVEDDPSISSFADLLLDYCSALGITIEELREANVKKLQSRKERGKIKGDGDER